MRRTTTMRKTTMMQIYPNMTSGEMMMMMITMKLKKPWKPSRKILQRNHRNLQQFLVLLLPLDPHLLRPVEHLVETRTNDRIPVLDRLDPTTNHPGQTDEGLVRTVVHHVRHLAPNQFRPKPATVAVPVPDLRPDLAITMAIQHIVRVPIIVREVVRRFITIRKANTQNDRVVRCAKPHLWKLSTQGLLSSIHRKRWFDFVLLSDQTCFIKARCPSFPWDQWPHMYE